VLMLVQDKEGYGLFSDLIGKPFKDNGKGPDGYDCYGLCQEVYKRIGKALPDFDYSFSTHASPETAEAINFMIKKEHNNFKKIEKPEPYCIVTFCIVPPFISHIGVVLDDCVKFIHISRRNAVVIDRLTSVHWQGRIRGYYKWEH